MGSERRALSGGGSTATAMACPTPLLPRPLSLQGAKAQGVSSPISPTAGALYRLREHRESLVDLVVVEMERRTRMQWARQIAAARAAHLPDGSGAHLRMDDERLSAAWGVVSSSKQ